jgi:hypothetical protein
MDEFQLEQSGVGFDEGGYFDLPCCEAAPPGFIPEPVYVPPPESVYIAPIEPVYQEPIYQAPEPIFEPAPVFEPIPIEEQFFVLPYEGFEPEPIFQPEPIAYIEPFSPIAAPPPAFEPVFQEPVSDSAFQIEQPPPVFFEPAPIEEQFFALPFVPEPEPIVIEDQFFALPVPPTFEPVPIPAPAPMPAGYVGCYADTSNRDLPYWAPGGPYTVAGCQSACAAAGYQYAGVQYGGECFCGDAYGRYGPAVNCNMPCSVDPNQICGGKWAQDIYALPVAQQPEPVFVPEPVFIPEPVIEEQFFALPEPPPENFFRCRPCGDGGAGGFSGFNGWGGV